MHPAASSCCLNFGNDWLLTIENGIDESLPAISHESGVVANGLVGRTFGSRWRRWHGPKICTGAKSLCSFGLQHDGPNGKVARSLFEPLGELVTHQIVDRTSGLRAVDGEPSDAA